MRVLGVNAVFHDPAAALVVDGRVVAAAEEERFTRRKHGKEPVPFSAWEQPAAAAAWCLEQAGLTPADLDAVGWSYDPDLVEHGQAGTDPGWEQLRTDFALRAPLFLRTVLPGLDPGIVQFVQHHVAHAASAALAAPWQAGPERSAGGTSSSAVLVADGRGESTSYLAGRYRDGTLQRMATQRLPDSLGLRYEDLTAHLGFRRSSDEYKVMALASYGTPRFADELAADMHATGDGGFHAAPVDLSRFAPARGPADAMRPEHADLAASLQLRLEETLLDLARWLHERTGERRLALAGGIALNCVANTRIADEGPFDEVWVQPAAGDAGTALGAALHLAARAGDRIAPIPGADLGRGWSDDEIEQVLRTARVRYERPDDLAATVAETIAADGAVAWFQGRSEFGPRALGHRSLLAHPGRRENLDRLNAVKSRESFRPVAPMVRAERAGELFSRGPAESPYMLFVHDVAPEWQERIPAVTHVDGTARVQTVERSHNPLLADLLAAVEDATDQPCLINTSLNTAGRPMVDTPVHALETFGAAPVDLLALGPFVVRR